MKSTSGNDVVIEYNERNHSIRIMKVNKTLIVKAKGQEILRTRNAYLLDEYGHRPVYPPGVLQ